MSSARLRIGFMVVAWGGGGGGGGFSEPRGHVSPAEDR